MTLCRAAITVLVTTGAVRLQKTVNQVTIAAMNRVAKIVASFLPTVVFFACGGGGDAPKCIPGASIECACPTGQHGAQTCSPAGTFAACQCAPTVPDGSTLGGTGGTAVLTTPVGVGGQQEGGAGGLGGASGATGGGGAAGGTCTGTASTCGTYVNNSDCASVGCKWKVDECQGTPLPCPSPGTSTTCAAITGCYWSSLSSTCSGSPVSCLTRTERTACISQGCTWTPAACTGNSPPCSDFPNNFACTFAGCTWRSGNQTSPGTGGATSGSSVTGGITGAGGLTSTGGMTGPGGMGGTVVRGGTTVTGGITGPGGAGGTFSRGGTTGTGGITAAGGAGGFGGSTIVLTGCGNGTLDVGEQCDCGVDSKKLPDGCKATNGIFFGDGTGCSKTCIKEPSCLDGAGKTQACTTSCGDGNVDPGEACDDANLLDGDGCSSACLVESGFTCSTQFVQDGQTCASGSGQCLSLSMIYRDFQPENVALGGHPDFPFLGTKFNGTKPTTICVPNSSGPSKGNDSTARCWGIVADSLVGGRPQPGPTTTCACQFSDWNIGNTSRIPGGYTIAGNDSPLSDGKGSYQGSSGAGSTVNTTSTGGEYVGTITGYTTSTPGGPIWKGTVPTYKDAASFNQWFNDDPSVNKTFTGAIELSSIGSNIFQYASKARLAQGGFFPLDMLNPSQATLCSLWPYWNHGSGAPIWSTCSGDQYLFSPRVTASDCNSGDSLDDGCWVTSVSGVKHDSYFTDEARTYFVYDSTVGGSLSFYGDDDLFIFINGVLVLDLGGVHQQLPGKVMVTGEPGDAKVLEGGCLDSAGNLIGASAGSMACSPANASTKVSAVNPADFRDRTVKLGLQNGKVYELAIFGADRHPPESNFQLTLNGFTRRRSSCQPN